MALPISRQQFKDRCLRNLGYPVIEVMLDDQQVEDKIDEALQFFRDYHNDGTEKAYFKHKITQTDVDNQYIPIPEEIIGIIGVWDINSYIISNSLFGIKYQLALNDFFNISSTNIVYFSNVMGYIQLLNEMFSTRPAIRYNRHVNKLYLDLDWKTDLTVGQYIIADVYSVVDPDVYTDVWGDRFLQKYCTALLKKQQGTNLKLFNLTLPGNVTYNGDQMYQEAVAELEDIERTVIESYSLPITDFVY